MEKHCSSCKKKVVNDAGAVDFRCPSCGKQDMVRCGNCRSTAAKYRCPECSFTGPN